MTRILLGASASAALHKSCELASTLTQQGHQVRAVLTPRAAQLIDPQLFQALTGEPAAATEFGEGRRGGMDHIDLAGWAELCLVAPASADLLSRLALGLGGDLLTTVALALPHGLPRLVAPAMNPHMWAAPAIARNVEQLGADSWRVIQPGEGHLACGVEGVGRLAPVEAILAAVAESLAQRSESPKR